MINEPILTVTCDKCGYTPDDPLEMTKLLGEYAYDCRDIPKELISYGWTLPKRHNWADVLRRVLRSRQWIKQ